MSGVDAPRGRREARAILLRELVEEATRRGLTLAEAVVLARKLVTLTDHGGRWVVANGQREWLEPGECLEVEIQEAIARGGSDLLDAAELRVLLERSAVRDQG